MCGQIKCVDFVACSVYTQLNHDISSFHVDSPADELIERVTFKERLDAVIPITNTNQGVFQKMKLPVHLSGLHVLPELFVLINTYSGSATTTTTRLPAISSNVVTHMDISPSWPKFKSLGWIVLLPNEDQAHSCRVLDIAFTLCPFWMRQACFDQVRKPQSSIWHL